jgi:hypothetical protein
MLETFSYEQLDPATKAYLRDVRAMKGRGAPGMFYHVGTTRPVWALIAGIFILPFFLWIANTSTKSPFAVAMLQTAAILLGGWLILYAFRRWLASADNFAGWFFYFDPAHAYIGEGETVRVAALPSDTEITPVGEGVRFMTQHDGFTVAMPNRLAAAFVSDFYAAVDWVMARETGPWANLPLAEVGGVAKYLVEEDAEPPSIQDCGLRIDTLPDEVTAVRKPKSGMLGYLAVVGVGLLLFGLFWTINPRMQDDRNFGNAVEKANSPEDPDMLGAEGYRDYLLNDRNTRHRDEAIKAISDIYEKPINRIKSAQAAFPPTTDPILSNGMIELLESLRGPTIPVVSIEVTDKALGPLAGGPMANGLREYLSDGIAKALGKDIITFVKKPDELPGVPAMLDVKFEKQGLNQVKWWVELRLKADEKPIAVQEGRTSFTPAAFGGFNPKPLESTEVNERGPVTSEITEAVYKDIMMKMVGNAPPRVMVPIINDF